MAERRTNRRTIQAEATRRDILKAARRLFVTRGYAATTMAAIAEEADAAMQTIYSSVGSKHAILLALIDLMDEEAGVRPMWRRVDETRDSREIIRLGVNLPRLFYERCGDVIATMLSAAPVEPDIAAALAESNRRHREGTRRLAERIAQAGDLRDGLTLDRAGDIFGMLTWVTTFRELTDTYGWTLDECEEWMASTLAVLLLRGSG